MIQSPIDKIVMYHREHGVIEVLKRCLIKVKNTLFFYNKEVVGCLSVIDQDFRAHPKIPVTIRAADRSDIPELKMLTADYKKRDFLQWINEHYICYIAQPKSPASRNASSSTIRTSEDARASEPDKKIIGYICVCPAKKSRHKLVSLLKLKDTDYWGVDAYIHPDYRGNGITAAIASGLLMHAKEEGFKRGYGAIVVKNKASRRSFSFIGTQEIGLFTAITIMGLTFYFLKRNKGYEDYFN